MVARKRTHRTKANGRDGEEQYLKLSYPFLRSPAWRSLSGPAVKVWLELRSRFNGRNNGELSLSLDEASRLLGMSKSTVRRVFVELEEKGFIRKVKPGQWYGRTASEYAVTDRPFRGQHASNDWKRWQSPKRPKTESRYSGGTIGMPDGAISVPKP
jgi:DNA-binding transcriptional ArsR family regulator